MGNWNSKLKTENCGKEKGVKKIEIKTNKGKNLLKLQFLLFSNWNFCNEIYICMYRIARIVKVDIMRFSYSSQI